MKTSMRRTIDYVRRHMPARRFLHRLRKAVDELLDGRKDGESCEDILLRIRELSCERQKMIDEMQGDVDAVWRALHRAVYETCESCEGDGTILGAGPGVTNCGDCEGRGRVLR